MKVRKHLDEAHLDREKHQYCEASIVDEKFLKIEVCC